MSAKNLDRRGRFRSKIIAFRVSPEEGELINRKAKLAGGTKQDYLIAAVLDKEIAAKPSPYVIHCLRKELKHFITLYGSEISEDDQEMMHLTMRLIQHFNEQEKAKENTVKEPRQ